MKKDIGNHIIDKLDLQHIVDVLSNKLSGSELNSVLLNVFDKRVQQETPASLLRKYEENRLVKPIDIDVVKFREDELYCYKILSKSGFEPLELSPVAQMGTSSVVATVDQKKILTALRNTEVQSDPTNAIALHYSMFKKKRKLENKTYNYCNISRVLRTQVFSNPEFTPHFSVLSSISCGIDTGDFNFEKNELLKQMSISYKICEEIFGLEQIYFEIIPCKGYDNLSPLIIKTTSHVQSANNRELKLFIVDSDHDNNYYHGFRIKLKVRYDNVIYEIGDGGLLDWTQQILNNKKERMMTMGLGLQVLHQIANKYGKR